MKEAFFLRGHMAASLDSWKETFLIGVDEAGRGCLAGPVYAGAVILDPSKSSAKFRDSKKMSESAREEIFEVICSEHRVGIGFATVAEITELNILNAALLAMRRAVENIGLSDEELQDSRLLVDGNQKIRGWTRPQTTVVGGDDKFKAISAASILAKVSRDREMRRLHEIFPQYGYSKHKGYGTADHLQAIREFGVTEHHRPTFAGVREHVAGPALRGLGGSVSL